MISNTTIRKLILGEAVCDRMGPSETLDSFTRRALEELLESKIRLQKQKKALKQQLRQTYNERIIDEIEDNNR